VNSGGGFGSEPPALISTRFGEIATISKKVRSEVILKRRPRRKPSICKGFFWGVCAYQANSDGRSASNLRRGWLGGDGFRWFAGAEGVEEAPFAGAAAVGVEDAPFAGAAAEAGRIELADWYDGRWLVGMRLGNAGLAFLVPMPSQSSSVRPKRARSVTTV
jgi:hypothetical protein